MERVGFFLIYVVRLFRFRSAYLVAGLCLLGLGVANYAAARATRPVELDGTESSYFEITYNGGYTHSELQLNGDLTTYTLDKRDFRPPLPDHVYNNGKMQIWIDQGSTTIIAVTLYDETDQNPTKHTTAQYDNPQSALPGEHAAGIVLSGIGVIALVVFAVWPGIARRRAAQQSASTTFAGVGLSRDRQWYWDGVQWRTVSPDGRLRWDGAQWRPLGDPATAIGAPPPPEN